MRILRGLTLKTSVLLKDLTRKMWNYTDYLFLTLWNVTKFKETLGST